MSYVILCVDLVESLNFGSLCFICIVRPSTMFNMCNFRFYSWLSPYQEPGRMILKRYAPFVISVCADDPGKAIVTEEETISNIKPVQLKMLSLTIFSVSEEKKYPNVKIEIDHSKNEIVFKGGRADIMHIKLDMFETLSKFSIRILNISESQAELFRAKHVQRLIAAKLQSKYPVCTWDVTGSELMICSSEADIVSCVKIVSETVKEVIIPLNCESVGVLYTHTWPTKLTDLHKEGRFIYQLDSAEYRSSIRIIATDDIVNEVVGIVKGFLKKHASIKKEYFSTDPYICDPIVKFKNLSSILFMEKAREIEDNLSMHFVSIEGLTKCRQHIRNVARNRISPTAV